jgi:hypothetical protein
MPNLYVSKSDFGLLIDKKDLRKALRKVGNQVKANARQLILAPKTGVQYSSASGWNRATSRRHTASAPGEAPASKTGLLASSMKVTLKKDTITVTDAAWYAVALEAGATGGGRGKGGKSGKSIRLTGGRRSATTDRIIAPRPYLSTALEQTDVESVLVASLNTIIQKRTTF